MSHYDPYSFSFFLLFFFFFIFYNAIFFYLISIYNSQNVSKFSYKYESRTHKLVAFSFYTFYSAESFSHVECFSIEAEWYTTVHIFFSKIIIEYHQKPNKLVLIEILRLRFPNTKI